MTFSIIFLVVALCLFGIAAYGVASRFNLLAGGLFFFVLSILAKLPIS